MIPAAEALDRLREGNARFAERLTMPVAALERGREAVLGASQQPFAIILGCSDSRVPAELIFDQGFGDLFVIRVAGNIVAPSQVGSIELAATRFNTRLVVVLGHTRCGAIEATLEELRRPVAQQSPNLRSIFDRVRPSVEMLLETHPAGGSDEELIAHAVRANVRASVNHLRNGSAVLESLIATSGLWVVGAEYSLTTGLVDFLDSAD